MLLDARAALDLSGRGKEKFQRLSGMDNPTRLLDLFGTPLFLTVHYRNSRYAVSLTNNFIVAILQKTDEEGEETAAADS